MLRSTKIVYRPQLIETRINKPKQLGTFLFALFIGLMCNLMLYQNHYTKNDLIIFEPNSDLYKVNNNYFGNISYSLVVKPVPKPDIVVSSQNVNISTKLMESRPLLEKILSSDYNRTDTLLEFAKNLNNGTTLIMFREFSGGIELETVIYYARPVSEIAEIYIIW